MLTIVRNMARLHVHPEITEFSGAKLLKIIDNAMVMIDFS